jgi:hypothetical protein
MMLFNNLARLAASIYEDGGRVEILVVSVGNFDPLWRSDLADWIRCWAKLPPSQESMERIWKWLDFNTARPCRWGMREHRN